MEHKSSFKFEPLPDNVKADIQRTHLSWEKFRKPFRYAASITTATSRLEQLSLIEDIAEMARNCDIAIPRKVTSHRKVLGPYIIKAKQTLMRLATPVMRLLLSRQIVFNDYTLALAQRVAFLEDRLHKLELDIAKQLPQKNPHE